MLTVALTALCDVKVQIRNEKLYYRYRQRDKTPVFIIPVKNARKVKSTGDIEMFIFVFVRGVT